MILLTRLRQSARARRGYGIISTVLVYGAALAAAVLVVRGADFSHPLVALLVGTTVATAVVFAASLLLDNSSVYDPYWSLQPLAFVAYYLWESWQASTKLDARQGLAAVLVLLYAVRLTSNFYRDWPGLIKEDFRYADLRARSGRWYWIVSLLGIHLVPTEAVYLACLPLYGIFREGNGGLGWLDVLGGLVVFSAVVVAFVADEQLRAFRNDPGNRGQVIRYGLWSYSRHPNYLGEIMTWWGLWLLALGAGWGWWWTGAGALVVSLLFVFISVPLMEKRLLSTRPDYAEYKKVTAALLPLPRHLRTVGPQEERGA